MLGSICRSVAGLFGHEIAQAADHEYEPTANTGTTNPDAAELWRALDANPNAIAGRPWIGSGRVMACRAGSAEAATWRWSMPIWTDDDRKGWEDATAKYSASSASGTPRGR